MKNLFFIPIAASVVAFSYPLKRLTTQQTVDKMTCNVAGMNITATGDQVSAGALGISADSLSLVLGLNVDKNGGQLRISTALMSLPLRVGTYRVPTNLIRSGSFEQLNSEGKTIKQYSQALHTYFFATSENDPSCDLQITIARVEKFPSTMPDYIKFRMKGSFKFDATNVPSLTQNSSMSDACNEEAARRSEAGGPKFPMFDAKTCGAETAQIDATFDVITVVAIKKKPK